jgi:hypothetical protein
MVIPDCGPDSPRSGVHHQPKTIITIRLQLREMITTTERSEFERSLVPPGFLEWWATQRGVGQLSGQIGSRLSIPTSGRHGMGKLGQQPRGVSNAVRGCIKRHRQYPAADVTTDSLWVDQMRSPHCHTNANVGGKVDVWHYRDMLDVCRTAKPSNCVPDVTVKRIDEPCM